MKTINNFDIATTLKNINTTEIYNPKYILGTVLAFSGYKFSRYLFSDKNESEVEAELTPEILPTPPVNNNNLVTPFDFASSDEDNTIIFEADETIIGLRGSKESKESTEEVKINLLAKINELRMINKNFIDQIIIHRKLLCNNNLKEKLIKNDITINGKTVKPNLELIYIDTLNYNDRLNTILNSIEETIKWIYWFKNDLEIQGVFEKIIYHDKISVISTLDKLKFNTNELPDTSKKNEMKYLINQMTENLKIYNSEVNLILNLSKYIINNNDELNKDDKAVGQVTSINKVVENSIYYYKLNFNEQIKVLNNNMDAIQWLDYHQIEEFKEKYKNSITKKDDFYHFVKTLQ